MLRKIQLLSRHPARWLPLSSLSFKIFVSFWVAMTVAGLVLLALEATRTDRLTKRWLDTTSDVFGFYADSAAKDYEERKAPASANFLSGLAKRTGIRAFLLNSRGEVLAGHTRMSKTTALPWNTSAVLQLRERADRTEATQFQAMSALTLAAHTTQLQSGKRYTLVGELPPLRYGPWQARPQIQILRLISVLVVAGVVSWLLGHYLVLPIEQLRTASRQLAAGDLTARAQSVRDESADELDQLAQDFNEMAGRIEALMKQKEFLVLEKENLVASQRRLLRDVAHELRSPLARLNVAVAIARDEIEYADEPPQDFELSAAVSVARREETADSTGKVPRVAAQLEMIGRIEREGERLGEMIQQLLDLSRLESGVISSEQTLVDLSNLISDIASDADFEANPQNRIVSVTRCEPCILSGNPSLLQSTFENIIRNAIRYSPEGKPIEVALHREETSAIVTVRDYGSGVPANHLTYIFQPFYRAEESREENRGGAGLGLAIALRAVQLHGGKIEAENAEGGGLRITVIFPLSTGPV